MFHRSRQEQSVKQNKEHAVKAAVSEEWQNLSRTN